MKRIGTICLWAASLLCSLAAGAQEKKTTSGALPPDVYYLMPSFGKGMVFFTGQAPAQGDLNICALDNTLRFLDESGKELSASNDDNVVRVQIDTAVFLHYGNVYYRIYPVSDAVGLAVKRHVVIETDVKTGAYGMTSRTSSIREYSSVYTDGVAYKLENNKEYPYSVTETLFLFKGNDIIVFNKKNLRKLFPDRKADIDAYFKSGGSLPKKVPEALAFLSGWAE